jgi:hypothetical protein
LEEMIQQHITLMQKVAVLEANSNGDEMTEQLTSIERAANDLDKRVTKLETAEGKHTERWRTIGTFILQLIWVVLAAYVLLKLNLQAPAIP